jgi:hypothetical protein
LKGFTKEWEVFMKCVVGCEHIPYRRTLWDDFTKDNIYEESQRSGQDRDGADEDNVSLVANRKGEKKGNFRRVLSKFRCYFCNQLGHLASQCPEKKKKKKEQEGPDTTNTTTMEDFSSKFDMDFSLATLVSSVGSGGFMGDNRWIVDNGASYPMMGIWNVFLIITKTCPNWLVVSEGDVA